MNILLDPLPSAISIEYMDYPIYTDFRVWMRFDILFSDSATPLPDKFIQAVHLCFDFSSRKSLPPTWTATLQGLFAFYTRKADASAQEGSAEEVETAKRIYSFAHDADYIYAAFRAQYGIDLRTEPLHWWEFHALFRGLGKEHKICEIMSYRSADLSTIKDKQQKAFYRKMQALYRLPDMRSDEEREADIAQSISKMI